MLDLRVATNPAWTELVLERFDEFLADHAACERKASATGLAFVSRYPDRLEIVRAMIEFSLEELEHFQRVYLVMESRGLRLGEDYKDPYVTALRAMARRGGTEGLVDGLLVAGVVEARGCERLKLVAEALAEDSPLKAMYLDLARAEARHHGLFFRLARGVASEAEVRMRADQLLEFEGRLIGEMPLLPRVH
jgi:tRNA 2-(methylsulfanyl)-N6-isopentenyladenosine37 hydroxylase